MADELAADGNVDGGLLLVSCDDPHLHRQTPIPEVVQAFCILTSCQADIYRAVAPVLCCKIAIH